MLIRFLFLFAATMAVFVSGCDWFASSREPVGEIPVLVVPADFVLAEVNGSKVTAGDFRARFDVEKAIYSHANGKKPSFENSFAAFKANRMTFVLPELVNQRLVSQYLKSENVKIQPKAADVFVEDCLKKLHLEKGGLKGAAAKLKVDVGYLRDQLLVPLRVDAARSHFGNGPFTVTEKEIDEGLARQVKYHDFAVASNAVTYATCSNILKMVTSGGRDFAETGLKYGQYLPHEAVRWERMEYSEIENAEMKEWVFKAPIGSIGGPFDLDDGLSIVKILERTEGTLHDSMASAQVADVTLARITFYMLETDPEPKTREFVRESLIRWKAEQAQKGLFEKLHGEMKLKYPNGRNFTFAEGDEKHGGTKKETSKGETK